MPARANTSQAPRPVCRSHGGCLATSRPRSGSPAVRRYPGAQCVAPRRAFPRPRAGDVSGALLRRQLTPHSRIFLALEPIDGRKGIDGLAAVCRQALGDNPLDGAVYVFRTRTGTTLKLLTYDGQGVWLCTN